MGCDGLGHGVDHRVASRDWSQDEISHGMGWVMWGGGMGSDGAGIEMGHGIEIGQTMGNGFSGVC